MIYTEKQRHLTQSGESCLKYVESLIGLQDPKQLFVILCLKIHPKCRPLNKLGCARPPIQSLKRISALLSEHLGYNTTFSKPLVIFFEYE